jgi:DNA-binding MarR family transcriptional regulator
MSSTPAVRARGAVSCRPALLAAELRIALMKSVRRLRNERSDESLTDGQYSVLAWLESHGPLTPRELADHEHVQPPSMTRTLNALVEAGLVTRTEHPADRRQVLVAVNDAGVTVVKETRRRRDEWLTRRLAALAPADREVLARATEILHRMVAP